jgi:hypothetical protein
MRTSQNKSRREKAQTKTHARIRPTADIIHGRSPNELVAASRSHDDKRDDNTKEEENMADSTNDLEENKNSPGIYLGCGE